jgi:cutinase-like protein
MGVYPVDYPATVDFPTALDGIRDASAHIESTAANCPNTKMVLGGFSQGAAVMGFVTANVIPDGAPDGVPNPMPPDVANHVAAMALFGKPNARFMRAINQPQIDVGPQYAAKTIDLCVPDDFVCSSGRDFNAHTQYADAGMVDEAATYTANHVLAALGPAAPPDSTAPAPPPFNALRPLPPGTLLRCDTVCHIIGPA